MIANYTNAGTPTMPVPQPMQSTTRTQPMPTAPAQTQQMPQGQPNYSNWINPQPTTQIQPVPFATEQRGITVCYMVNNKSDYNYYTPMAGQTIALFNFSEHELCLKAKDVYGIDLSPRTWSLTETTPNPMMQPSQTEPCQLVPESTVPKAEFDDLKAKFEALYNELKG